MCDTYVIFSHGHTCVVIGGFVGAKRDPAQACMRMLIFELDVSRTEIQTFCSTATKTDERDTNHGMKRIAM